MSRTAFAPIFFASLLALARAASAEPELIVGDPFDLDEPVPGTGGWPFFFPAIAASDAGFLAVWAGYGAGSRLDAETLEPLDPGGLSSLAMFGEGTILQVESNGATYFVLDVDVASCESGGGCLMGRLIDAETGAAISDKISLAPDASGDVPMAALATTEGGNYLISWVRNSGLPTLHATRIDGSTGALLDGESGFELCSAGSSVNSLASAANADGALIAFDDGEEVRAVRVLWDGSVPDPDGFVLEGVENHFENDIIAAGDGFVVVWKWYVATNAAVLAATVDPESGATSAPVVLYESPDEDVIIYSSCVAAAGDGSSAVVVWSEEDMGEGSASDDVYGVLLDVGGSIEVSERFAIAEAEGEQSAPGVAFRDGAYAAVWEDSREGSGQIWGTRFDTTGLLLADAVPLGTAPNGEWEPKVAAGADAFFAVWTDSRSHGADVYGVRISPDGVPLDAPAIPVRTGAGSQYAMGAAALEDGFYVAWRETDPSWTTGSFGVTRIDALTGAKTAETVLAEGGTIPIGGDIVSVPEAGAVFAAHVAGFEIWGATVGAGGSLVAPVEPLYISTVEILDLNASAIGTVAILAWSEISDLPDCTLKAARFDLSTPTAITPLGPTVSFDDLCMRDCDVAVLAGDFQIVCFANDPEGPGGVLFRLALPVDPGEPIPERAEIGEFDRRLYEIDATPFEGGLFLSTLVCIPFGEEGYCFENSAGLFIDSELTMPFDEVVFGEPYYRGAAAASEDVLLHVDEAQLYGSARAVGRLIRLEDGPEDAGTEDGSVEVRASAGCTCATAGARSARKGLLSILL